MALYAMSARSPYQRPFRCLAISAISLLLLALLFSIWTPISVTDRIRMILGWVTGALVLVTVMGAYWLGIKDGLWKAVKNYCLEWTDAKLVQRRPGSPVVEIRVDQITEVAQNRSGWLLIDGGEPSRRIVVPAGVLGMEDLRRELSINRKIVALKPSPTSFLISAIFVVAGYFLLLSHNRMIILAAGSAAVLIDFRWLYTWLRHTKSIPKARLATIGSIFGLLILICLVIERALWPS